MEMFLDLAEHRNTIASRSTKVTLARFRDIVSSVGSPPRSCWISERYSFVSCPHNRISRDFSLLRIGVIFSTFCYRPTGTECKLTATTRTRAKARRLQGNSTPDPVVACFSPRPWSRIPSRFRERITRIFKSATIPAGTRARYCEWKTTRIP